MLHIVCVALADRKTKMRMPWPVLFAPYQPSRHTPIRCCLHLTTMAGRPNLSKCCVVYALPVAYSLATRSAVKVSGLPVNHQRKSRFAYYAKLTFRSSVLSLGCCVSIVWGSRPAWISCTVHACTVEATFHTSIKKN